MKKSISCAFKLLLVALFLSYYASGTLFYHTHSYAWGKVTHSHPYLPSAAHAHNTVALSTIGHLSHIVALAACLSVFFAPLFFIPFLYGNVCAGSFYVVRRADAPLRAPPVCC